NFARREVAHRFGGAVLFKLQRLEVEIMRYQDQLALEAAGELGPDRVIAIMRNGEERELPVRPPDRDRETLIADTMRDGIGLKCARLFARPVEPFPVNRVKPLKAADDHRVDAQVILIDIVLHPDRRIGATAILLSVRADPVIDDMVDTVVV